MKGEILYNPELSVKENAKANGVSEANIRYYIKKNGIDRRADEKVRRIELCRNYYKRHKTSNIHQVAQATEISYFFIKQHWNYIIGEKAFDNFDNKKIKKREAIIQDNYFKPHPSVVRDLLREIPFTDKIITDNKDIAFVANKCGKLSLALSIDNPKKQHDIIIIPSVNNNLKIIAEYLKVCKYKVAVLLPLSFLTGTQRHKSIFSKLPLSEVLIYIEDVNIERNEDIKGVEPLSFDNYAWYIFERSYNGEPHLKWIHNDKSLIFVNGDTSHTTVLNGIPFNPNEWYEHRITDVIQFHSKALPENYVMSNHCNCIILFRGVEFYGVEQLFSSLIFSDSPAILERFMRCKSVAEVNKLDKIIGLDKGDWNYKVKQYQIIAICHLYKYLSFKPYRDRLRETRGQILVECPNGSDYHFACVQNLDTNILEGNNCSGRTTMIVRDMMLDLEDKAINEAQIAKGEDLTEQEKENVIMSVLNKVRYDFDNNPYIKAVSDKLIDFIESNKIPKERPVRPKPIKEFTIDRESKCLVLDFDNTLFDTSVDDVHRKGDGKKNWGKIYSLIPKYKLYLGWEKVFEYIRKNRIKVGIISRASSELIKRAVEHFNLPIDVIIGYQPYIEKPNPILGNMLMEKLFVRENQILYVGDSLEDDKQARSSMMKFVGAVWDSKEEKELREKCDVIENPIEIIPILESLNFGK